MLEDLHPGRESSRCLASIGFGVFGFFVLLALTPAVVPISWRWGSCNYHLVLGQRTDILYGGRVPLYPDPELVIGPWSYRLATTPVIGIPR